MFKMIFRTSVALMLLGSLFYNPPFAIAQIAPTNTATISGSVSDREGKPVANAKVALSGLKNTSTQTDTHGLFVFIGVPFGTYQISAAAESLGTATRSVSVEGDTNVAIRYEPLSQNGLKVIAQVSSNAVAVFNVTSASITQVNPIANAFEGKTSWRTILEQIPGVAQAGLGNGCYGQAAYPDGPLVPMQISINGALPYETATLLDGMPLIGMSLTTAAGEGTNIGSYPLNGFDAADVVRGPGANAPSIVDSIGGSFVLHAPGVVSKNHYDLSLSTDPYGGIIANALVAMRWKKLSAMVTYGVNDSPGPISVTGPALRYGYILQTVNGQSFSDYSPPCNAPNCMYGSYLVDPNYAAASFPAYGQQGALLTCCVNYRSSWTQHGGSLALTYAFSPSITAQVFYAAANSLMPGPSQYYIYDFLPPVGYTGTTGRLLLPIYASAADSTYQNVSSLLEEKITAQLGHGTLRLAALQNRSFATYGLTYPANAVVQLYGAGYLNGSPNLTIFNGDTVTAGYRPASSYNISWANNRDLLMNYTTSLGDNFHAGVSFVQSYYDNPSTATFSDVEFGLNLTRTGVVSADATSQTTNEIRFFIGGNPSAKTSLDFSMYFANAHYHVPDPNGGISPCVFTDVPGGVLEFTPPPSAYTDARYSYAAPRLGFIWRPTPMVAIRASAGGGFAEAPLHDLVGTNRIPFDSGLGYYVVTLTNINLQPEKSFTFNLGTDVRLPHGTVLSFDVYRSNLYGQLYQSTSITGTCSTCNGEPLYTTQYGNLGVSRFEGVLLDLHHDVPHGLYWLLSGGLTRGYVVSVPSGFYDTAGATCDRATGANCVNLTVVPNVNFNGTFVASIPYAQGLGTLGYRWNVDKYANLTATYFGNNNTYFRPAFIELDGNVAYPLTKNASLLATFRNITGIYDRAAQVITPSDLSGAPTISGLPNALFGEEYGPRTVLLTLMMHM